MPYRSPLLDRRGAVEAAAPDAGVAAHYGEPVPEQRRLLRGSRPAAVDLSHRDVVSVAGPDRASWLTTLTSQVLDGLPAGASAETAFLTPQGRLEYLPHVLVGPEKIWLLVEAGQGEPLTEYLERMKFMLRVEIRRETEDLAVVGAVRDLRGSVLPEDTPTWEDPWPAVGPGGTTYSSAAEHPGEDWAWFEHLVPRSELAGLDVDWSGIWAAEALRIEAWRPRFATEADERTIPHELDLMRTAVHLAKGCYKGQETVARVHNLGHPPRRLVFLDLDGSEHTLPARGSLVYGDGKRPVGTVTSTAFHHEAGPIALAVVKRSVDPEADLLVVDEGSSTAGEPANAEGGTAGGDGAAPERAEYAAAQTVIVDPEAGQAVGRRNRNDFLR